MYYSAMNFVLVLKTFQANISSLIPVFENFLAEAPDSASFDAVRQSVVILMGSLAKHLDKDDPRVKPIVAKLIETLSTPSQPVSILSLVILSLQLLLCAYYSLNVGILQNSCRSFPRMLLMEYCFIVFRM